jgi:putative Mg2+ transporter-C (MgtC) family protein
VNYYLHFTLDLLAAALFGGLIGVQRQASHKPAGLRTHVLVALGACAFMETSRLVGDSRIAAGVITGIGFLGAGAIVRRGEMPHGLTTAASIWSAAAVGLAFGLGSVQSQALAVVTAVVTLCALSMSDGWVHKWFPARAEVDVNVTFDAAVTVPDAIRAMLAAETGHAKAGVPVDVTREGEARIATVLFRLRPKHHHDWVALVERVVALPGVRRVWIGGDAAEP